MARSASTPPSSPTWPAPFPSTASASACRSASAAATTPTAASAWRRKPRRGTPTTTCTSAAAGLFAVPITIAYDAGDYAKIGAFYSLERGTIESRWLIDFEEGNADALSIEERRLTGHGLGAGLVSRPVSKLSIGLTWESKIDYDVEVHRDPHRLQRERRVHGRGHAARAHLTPVGLLPHRARLRGLRRRFGVRLPRLRGTRVPAGTAWRAKRSPPWAWSTGSSGPRIPVRASFRYEQLPYTLPDGEEIKRLAFTIGTGFVLRGGRGKIDTALQFGSTGSVDTNQFADRSVRVYVSITGSEEWKREREGEGPMSSPLVRVRDRPPCWRSPPRLRGAATARRPRPRRASALSAALRAG